MIVTLAQVKTYLGLTDPCQASGSLTVGQLYEIKENTSGDFSNVGADDNNVGTQFHATGTTPTSWGDGILYIVDETRDDRISALLSIVEADYLRIRNIPFIEFWADATVDDATLENITIVDDTDAENLLDITDARKAIFKSLERGMVVSGTGVQSKIDDYEYDLTDDSRTIEMDDVATATGEEVLVTAYPAGADYTAALMIEYNLYKRHGFSSERTGDYSYSQEEIVSGYPKSITGMIRRYVRMV